MESKETAEERLVHWCRENGVIMPKLEYPAVFEGGLQGMRVKEDIEYREAFLFIPFNMLMSLETAKAHPHIS